MREKASKTLTRRFLEWQIYHNRKTPLGICDMTGLSKKAVLRAIDKLGLMPNIGPSKEQINEKRLAIEGLADRLMEETILLDRMNQIYRKRNFKGAFE